jgi:hypothetical protein
VSRKRLIAPAFFTNADLYDAEAASGLPLRIAYAGLWTVTDRRGVFKWSRNLKPEVLPYDACDILACLEELARVGLVVRYEVGGRKYGWIPTFTAHQTFHLRERPSSDPAPPDEVQAAWSARGRAGIPAPSCSNESTGPAQGQHGASPDKAVPSPTVTGTVAVTGTVSTTTTPLLPEQPAKAAGGGWPAAVAAVWVREVGLIREGRVGKDLLPFVRLYGDHTDHAVNALTLAIPNYADTCRRREERPRWVDFVTNIRGHLPRTMQPPERAA